MFVHCYLSLAYDFYSSSCESFFKNNKERFEREHSDELAQFSAVTTREHVMSSNIAQTYRNNKYRVSISTSAYNVLLQFLESKDGEGKYPILGIIQQYVHINTIDHTAASHDKSLAAMLSRPGQEYDVPTEDEGIPGHHPGSANTDINAPKVLTKLALGPLAMDEDFKDDVRVQLEAEDAKVQPAVGEKTLVETFDDMVKVEPAEEGPRRDNVPLPPPMARDVFMEVQKVREHRDRFKIDPRTSGVAPGVSVCMYTFHNTFDG